MSNPLDPIDMALRASGPSEALRQTEALLHALLRRQAEASSVAEKFELGQQIGELRCSLTLLTRVEGSGVPLAPAEYDSSWKSPLHTSSVPSPPPTFADPPSPLTSPKPPPRLTFPQPQPPRPAPVIHFLGRGVSSGLHDHRADFQRLQQADLPILLGPHHLAVTCEISLAQLRWLAFHTKVASCSHYVHFQVPKRKGGVRTLSRPHQLLAGVQAWILEHILNKLPVTDVCHGFVQGRSIVTNARPHAQQDIVVNLDLENFFPSIVFRRVRKVFQIVGYSPAVATVLALLCTECPRRQVRFEGRRLWVAIGPRGLPQGACTSPALANQVAIRLDRRLNGLATKLGLCYTRYADDLSFSGPATFEPRLGYLLGTVERIAGEEGFALKRQKTRILRRNTRQVVTGLVVNDRPGVGREEVRRIRAILHRARTEGLAAQNREERPNFRAWLLGKIAYIRMVRPEVGAKLLAELLQLGEGESRAPGSEPRPST